MKDQIIQTIKNEKLIVIVRGIESKKLIALAEALYKGGVRLMEVTYSANGSVSDEETAKGISALCQHFGDRMFIGAGTVLTEKQVMLTKNAGAGFIISPNVNEAVIKCTVKQNMVSIPGAFSPTEIQYAHELGADFVKLFPVSSLGPEYVKAIKAPLSHIDILAVGGIDLDSMPLYLKSGACGFGISSNITNKEMIKNEDWDGIAAIAKLYSNTAKGE